MSNILNTKETDSFTCPANQVLTTNGNWYSKKNGKSLTQKKHYKTSACLSCELFAKCTKNARGRLIERSEHADLIYDNKIRIENNMKPIAGAKPLSSIRTA